MMRLTSTGLEVVSADPETGERRPISTFRPFGGKGVVVGAGFDRYSPNNRTQVSPDFRWIVLMGARYGFMNEAGSVVDVEDLLPDPSDFGYERRVAEGGFGRDGLYYFPTVEAGERTYWSVDPESKKIEQVAPGRVENRIGSTLLTRDPTEATSWLVPSRSGTMCDNALDVREGQCLFGSRTPDSGSITGDGRLEILNLRSGRGSVWWPNGSDSATSIKSVVPPNDRSYEGAVFSPDGSKIAFLAIRNFPRNTR